LPAVPETDAPSDSLQFWLLLGVFVVGVGFFRYWRNRTQHPYT
jgi:hypothetical protein